MAFVITIAVTQLWRLYSETLRADYRGGGEVSVYQWMAVAGVVYAAVGGFLLRAIGPALLSGRISDIAVHPVYLKLLFVASASGGL